MPYRNIFVVPARIIAGCNVRDLSEECSDKFTRGLPELVYQRDWKCGDRCRLGLGKILEWNEGRDR